MRKKKHNHVTNYIVMVADEFDSKHATLKQARNYCRSLMNLNEVKGISVLIDIYKETVALKKLSSNKTNDNIVGSVDKVFNI